MKTPRLLVASAAVLGPAAIASPAVAAPPAPFVTCVAPDPAVANGLVAYWGYSNTDPEVTWTVPGAGAQRNRFTTAPADRGQPTTFPTNAPGVPGYGDTATQIAVSTAFTGNLTWQLDGKTAQASSSSPACGFDAAVDLVPDRAAARPGDAITWTAVVRNAGATPFPWNERGLVLSATGGLALEGPASPAPDELMSGEAVTVPAGRTTVTPGQCFGSATASVSAAFVTSLIPTADANPANNTATAGVPVNCTVDVQVVAPFDKASFAPGTDATRTATVSNVGQAPLPLGALSVRDSALGAYAPVPGTPAVIPPGGAATFTVSAPVPGGAAACGTMWGTTTVAVGDASGRYVDQDTSSNTWTSSTSIAGGACGTAQTTNTPTNTPTAARLISASISAPTKVRRGGRGTYRVTVLNPGKTRMTALAVALSVPKRVIISQRLPGRVVRTGNTVWWRTGALAPGKRWTVSLKVRYPRQYVGKRSTLVRVFARGARAVRTVPVTRVLR